MYKIILRGIKISLDEKASEKSEEYAHPCGDCSRVLSSHYSARRTPKKIVASKGRQLDDSLWELYEGDRRQDARSDHQKVYTEAMLRASSRIMYGDEFAVNAEGILSRNNWNTMPNGGSSRVSCRFGKTWATAMFVVFCMAVPSCGVCIFSPSKRQSIMFKETVAQFIKSIKGGLEMIVKQNEESIFLRGTDSSDVPNQRVPRELSHDEGVGGDIIICEEMAELVFFFEVIVPLYSIDRASMIGISTVTDDGNFFSELLKLRNEVREKLLRSTTFL